MQVRGLSDATAGELSRELAAGGRLVYFEYCISVIFLTFRKPSRVYLLRPGQFGWWRGLPYSLVSLLLGWWGLPWGLIYTPLTLVTNLSGGRDVTAEIWAYQERIL
jgi:hypothetical protein